MSKPNTLTADEARRRLNYDPDTGLITWKLRSPSASKTGRCGCIVKRRHTHYINININDMRLYAHRLAWLIMTGEWPIGIDHIDGNGTNNAWNNLREVGQAENRKNMRKAVTNTSGFTGVHWDSIRKQWYAQIRSGGKQIQLGYFTNIAAAIAARKSADVKYGFHPNHGIDRAH